MVVIIIYVVIWVESCGDLLLLIVMIKLKYVCDFRFRVVDKDRIFVFELILNVEFVFFGNKEKVLLLGFNIWFLFIRNYRNIMGRLINKKCDDLVWVSFYSFGWLGLYGFVVWSWKYKCLIV